MDYALIIAVSLAASLLTLFTGFGLGTLLLPAFAAFFPLPLAIAMTALVHLANNLFKLAILGAGADRGLLLRFGVPAMLRALGGAGLLLILQQAHTIHEYAIGARVCVITWPKLVVGLVIIAFGVVDLAPIGQRWSLRPALLPLGGFISGFFGGLSGHQGALRSAFLVRCGLSGPLFIATGAVMACMVDLTRLGAYATHLRSGEALRHWPLLASACAAAFIGAVIGAKLMTKVTIGALKIVVAAALIVFGALMMAGLV